MREGKCPDQMELDLFCQWFEGEFDNWTQSPNPTQWAHIYVNMKE